MKLSIILPVYNVDQYIEKCIRSIECQDLPTNEYEIIAVNDGSLDNSVQIIEKLQNEFSNIQLINKNNGGLSSARNYGLRFAKGKYIWFIDSDDYIETNILQHLLDKIKNDNLDLLVFNIFDIWKDKEQQGFSTNQQPTHIISGEEYIKSYYIGISAWCFIVRKNILTSNNITFTEGIIHEDFEFTLRLYEHIKRMTFTPIRVYNYVHRNGSITTTKTHEQILKSIHSWQTIISQETNYFHAHPSSYARYAQKWIDTHKFNAICAVFFNHLTIDEKKTEFYRLKDMGAFKIKETRIQNIKLKFICNTLKHRNLYYILMHFFRTTK